MVKDEVTALPEGVTEAGLKLQRELAGSPEQERLTALLKPLVGVMDTVIGCEVCPTVTVTLCGEGGGENEKSPVVVPGEAGAREAKSPWEALARPAVKYNVFIAPAPPEPNTM